MHQHDKYDGQITVPLSALQQQTPATWSLRAISQPERVALSTIPSYAYQIEPLGYSMIYIIDSGVDPTSLVSLLSIVPLLLLMIQGIPRLYGHTQRSGASMVVSGCTMWTHRDIHSTSVSTTNMTLIQANMELACSPKHLVLITEFRNEHVSRLPSFRCQLEGS